MSTSSKEIRKTYARDALPVRTTTSKRIFSFCALVALKEYGAMGYDEPTATATTPSTAPTNGDDDDEETPLLGPSLEDLPVGVLEKVLLPLQDPLDLTMLAKVGRGCRAAVVASGLPRATGRVRLRLRDFVGSVERLSWARERGCRWTGGRVYSWLRAGT